MVNLARFGYAAPEAENQQPDAIVREDSQDLDQSDRNGDGAEQVRSYQGGLGLMGINSRPISDIGTTDYMATDGIRNGVDIGNDNSDSRVGYGYDPNEPRADTSEEDLKRAAQGVENDGYTSDEEAEKAKAEAEKKKLEEEQEKDQPGMESLKAFQQLLAMGFTYNQIYAGQTLGYTNEQMLDNASDSVAKGQNAQLVPEDRLNELAAREQVQQLMADSQLRAQMQDGEMAKNGVSATLAGAEQSYGVSRMAAGAMMS